MHSYNKRSKAIKRKKQRCNTGSSGTSQFLFLLTLYAHKILTLSKDIIFHPILIILFFFFDAVHNCVCVKCFSTTIHFNQLQERNIHALDESPAMDHK